MKTILITGARGYIAQSLTKALASDYNITGITRDDFDLTNYHDTCKFLQGKYFDTVIHTAVVGGNRLREEDSTIIKQNLDMYYNLINNKQHFGRFITFGSGAELEWPTTPYGYSKRIIAESMSVKDYCLNLRIFAVFDENELERRFIKSNITKYLRKENMIVHENKRMDFFYMKDLISVVKHILEQPEHGSRLMHCTYEKSHTLYEIAQMINNLSHHKVEIHVANQEINPYIGLYDLPPIELVGLERGIQEVFAKLTHDN
jgi:nucleoside-diphosphate-sugar epimerase